ncbi:hypothetical protein [uncultured Duncaniella sp.]|uniref:hypothetical protein n=1 Tax=uncultured Duncaniella sp. TaxID=2768039 RepID=UPI0026661624|nr:hypothetical protein [uncultured Duncaniella sp.]
MPLIKGVIDVPVHQDAGSRNSNNVDTTTCFGIPGSGLPRRHCNVDIHFTVVIMEDLSIYLSVNNGSFKQSVFGRNYSCRVYAANHPFRMYIPYGTNGWDKIQFFEGEKRCDDNVTGIVTSGTVDKAYENTYYFDWQFGPHVPVAEDQEITTKQLTKSMVKRSSHDGGESVADSHFVYMGKLTDYGWKEELQEDGSGIIYVCGGIVYPNATVDSDINAEAVPIKIPGLKTFIGYYPGDVLKKGVRKSCNRPQGFFKILKRGSWRDCKNFPGDESEDMENTVFRLDTREWIKADLTGVGGGNA